MGFGDWFRRGDRQRSGTSSSGGAEAGGGSSPVPETGRDDSATGRRDDGWDGGWRQVAPPTVTVARSSIGVSDGLRFRSGLASWQNVAFGGELGHAVLPSAPVGLIHGVARPGGARADSPGGPLLLRAARTGTDGEAEAATDLTPASAGGTTRSGATAGKPVPATVQRSGATASPGTPGGGAAAPEATAGAAPAKGTSARGPAATPMPRPTPPHPARTGPAPAPAAPQQAGPSAVRPRRTAPPLIVARRPAMVLRHIAGIAPTTASAPAVPVATTDVRPTAPERPGGSGRPIPAAPPGAASPPDRTTGLPAATTTRPALGNPLRELPAGAVPVGPAGQRGVVPTEPAGQQEAGMPVLQRQASDAAAAAVTTPTPEATKPSSRQQPSSRQLPSPEAHSPKAAPPPLPNRSAPDPGQASRSGPQGAHHPGGRKPSKPSDRPGSRQSPQPDGAGSPARTRAGIGSPLPSLPPTARLRSDAPLLGDRRRTQPGTTGSRPDTTSAGEPAAPLTSAPAGPAQPSAPLNTPPGMPVRSSPVPAPSAGSAPESATVRRTVDTMRTGTHATAPEPSAPAAPVRVRRIAPQREGGQPPGPAAGTSGQSPTVQRSRALLAGRALKVSTGTGEGFSAPRATAGSPARPVVAATWRRDVRQPGSDEPSPGHGSSGTGEHRTPSGAAPRRAAPPPRTRPVESASPRRTRATGSAPTPQGPTPGDTVQRSVPGNPTPGTARSAAPSGGTAAGDPGRAPVSGGGLTGRRPSAGGSFLRLVRRSVPGGTAAPAARRGARRPEREPAEPRSARLPGPPSPAARPAPATPYTSPSAASLPSVAQPVPVVRPHPPAPARPGAATAPVQRTAMPVVPESAGPTTTGPVAGDGAPLAGPPGLSVRVPRRVSAAAAGAVEPGTTAQALQRRAADAGITGVPVRAAPVKPIEPSRSGSADTDAPAANRITGTDIEELARRLLDPVSRLIRADLRRGRERAGRLYDGRR
ncbi:hypothetical protein ACFCZY_22460 [Streptomyces sp. NPDC056237]|uniref:hypothetical protein n=1 Tax=Streptomyces sp. NPDC056237 TaxID=3345758 RepID=UPI0035DF4FFC